jgi:cell division septation protein DedD
MPKNEEGEFELVVGNRQLLTIVFIMMVLFGVVFTMGYLVGRTATPEAGLVAAKGQPTDTAEQRPEPSQPMPAQPAAPTVDTPLAPGEAKVTPTGTVPVGGTPPAPAETEPPAPKPVVSPAKPAEPVPPTPGQTYLQVGAVKKPEAEVLVDVLRKKGYPALVAPVVPGQPEDAPWRALVGPFPDAASLAKARAELQNTFRDIIIRKY